MRGAGVGASSTSPLTRPCSQRQVKSPDSAPVGAIGALVSQVPTCAFSAGEIARPVLGVAVHQEVHRQHVAGRR